MPQIIYLHGFASGPKPQSRKVALLRTLGHEVHCLDTQGAYRPIEQAPVTGSAPGLILVAEDDDVVDAQETLALAGDCERLVLPRGGHELANTADYADTLARFIERITVAAP